MTTANLRSNRRISKCATDIAPRRGHCVPLSKQEANIPSGTPVTQRDTGERGLLRPGCEVRVDEHSSNAVIVKSTTRLKPGTRTDLQLLDRRRILSGQI